MELHQVAVTCEQVRQLGLPSAPLKAKEKDVWRWRETFGHEQTEIDAMVALHPDALRAATLDAIKPFYDDTLDRRVLATKVEMEKKANALQSRPDYEDVSTRIVDAWEWVTEAANKIWQFRARAGYPNPARQHSRVARASQSKPGRRSQATAVRHKERFYHRDAAADPHQETDRN